jgi:hypothetical protein
MEYVNKAWKSGTAGYKAMILQVCSLMWLRTIVNYQYKYGTPIKETVLKLYNQGGLRRFYSGLLPALIQGPIIKFSDTFANTIVLEIFNKSDLPIFIKTLAGSLSAALIRIILTPVDTVKTMCQVHGKEAKNIFKNKISKNGFFILYHGAMANFFITLSMVCNS